jgi:hypothetical protein
MGNDLLLDIIMPDLTEDNSTVYKLMAANKKKIEKITFPNTPPNQSPSLCLHDSGDQNLVLYHIDDKVGWGVFANKNFKR